MSMMRKPFLIEKPLHPFPGVRADQTARRRSFVRKACSAQTDINRFLSQRPIRGTDGPGGGGAKCCQGIDLGIQLDRLGYFGSRLVDIAPETKRPREAQTNARGPRICGARLSQEFDRLFQM